VSVRIGGRNGWRGAQMQKVNIGEKLSQFSEYWSPRVVGELNGQHVKLAKLKGEFTWHHHDDEDELFMVVQGVLTIRFPDGDVELREGEFLVIPRGVPHLPVAVDEVHVMLFEPAGTWSTGNVINDFTIQNPEHA
jgi:mannose-6-phosphate isomerase-like protein (cupin superfamily)